MRIYSYILAIVLSLITSQAFAAASLIPAWGVISSASGGKASAAQQGTNTLTVMGASVGKVGGKPTLLVGVSSINALALAVGDGVSDDSSNIQTIINNIVASNKFTWIDLQGKTYKLNTGIIWRCDFVGFRNGKLDFSNMSSGNAITVTGGASGSPYYQNRTIADSVELIGPGKTSSVNGIVFNTSSEAGTSHLLLMSVNVHDFAIGHLYQNNAYGINFLNSDILHCGTCASMPASQTNSGERLTYIGCTFYNSDLALNIATGNASFHLIACSIDYNGGIATINGGRIFLTDCHIEASDYPTAPPIYVSGNGGTFEMKGGWLLLTGAIGTHLMTAMVDCETTAGGGGGAWFDKVFMHNLNGTTDYFAIGSGNVIVKDVDTYDINYNPPLLSAVSNKLLDGGFESSTIMDWVFIANDTSAPNDRFVGANISLTLSNAYAHSGSQSLALTKVFGSGSQATAFIAIPIKPNSRVGFRLYYTKPGTQTGPMYLGWQYATFKGSNAFGVPQFSFLTGAWNSTTVNFTSSAIDWTKWSYTPQLGNNKVPVGATHLIIEINANSVNNGTIYFDDLIVTEM